MKTNEEKEKCFYDRNVKGWFVTGIKLSDQIAIKFVEMNLKAVGGFHSTSRCKIGKEKSRTSGHWFSRLLYLLNHHPFTEYLLPKSVLQKTSKLFFY